MAKKLKYITWIVLFSILLSGCAPLAPANVKELLHAPALGQGQGEIQKALAEYLGSDEAQYKFPKEGEQRSPLVMADLNGDGTPEGILFYSMPSGAPGSSKRSDNVYIAVLEKMGDEWKVTQDFEGPSTDVASVSVAPMFSDGTQQLIVGYAPPNLSTKSLVLYQYKEETLTSFEYPEHYSSYLFGDFTGQGNVELVVASAPESGGLQLRFVTGQNNEFEFFQKENLPAAVELDKNIDSCLGLYPSLGTEGEWLLVVDGVIAASKQIASQILIYRGSGEGFYLREDSAALLNATARDSYLLVSRDIDGDGIVEIPVDSPVVTLETEKRLAFVSWMDFTGLEPVEKQFGLLDNEYKIFISLPDDWKDSLRVVDGTKKGEWSLLDSSTGKRLLSLSVFAPTDALPIGAYHLAGTSGVYLVPEQGQDVVFSVLSLNEAATN